MIIEHHKETHILYEIMNYIINKTENNDENNLLFFSYFNKVKSLLKKLNLKLDSETNST